MIQRRAIEAFHAHWSDGENNPESEVYDGRMIPEDGIVLWAWEPGPIRHSRRVAMRGAMRGTGDWGIGLTGARGRLLGDVVADVCARVGAACDVSGLAGVVSGYGLAWPVSARAVLEPLVQAHGVDATERDGTIVFRMRGTDRVVVDTGRLVEDDGPALSVSRERLDQDGIAVRLRFVDAEAGYLPGHVRSGGSAAALPVEAEAPLAIDRGQAEQLAERLAEELMLASQRAGFAMAADGAGIEAGDVIVLGGDDWRVVEVSDGKTIAFEAVRAGAGVAPVLTHGEPVAPPEVMHPVEADVVIVDAPALPGDEDDTRPIAFAFAEPWGGSVTILGGADADQLTVRGRIERPCAMGTLVSGLYPHVSGRWQETSVWVSLAGGSLAAASELAVLNGANRALVETEGGWEMIQFRDAELVDVETWKLSMLLRGQQRSEDAMAAGGPLGSRILFLTGAEQRLDVADWERGLKLAWRAGEWVGAYAHEAGAGRPWSPAHLSLGWSGGDIALAGVRRARKDGDGWGAGNPPVEGTEGYRLRVTGEESDRDWEVTATDAIYPVTEQVVDFPAAGLARIDVAQLGPNGEPGGCTGVDVAIPAA